LKALNESADVGPAPVGLCFVWQVEVWEAKAAERDFAWIRICVTAVEVARLCHCRCLRVDNNPRNTRCLLPMSKAVRHNKELLLSKRQSCKTHQYVSKSRHKLWCTHDRSIDTQDSLLSLIKKKKILNVKISCK